MSIVNNLPARTRAIRRLDPIFQGLLALALPSLMAGKLLSFTLSLSLWHKQGWMGRYWPLVFLANR